MVYLVAVEIRDSGIHGKGVFVTEDVKKGQMLWKYTPESCKTMSLEELESLTPEKIDEEEMKNILWHGYLNEETNTWILPQDGSQFTNHSDNPNSGNYEFDHGVLEDEMCYALRDIKAGEELVEDYTTFPSSSDFKMMNLLRKWCSGRYDFEMSLVKPRIGQ